jgi:hypothetical protein
MRNLPAAWLLVVGLAGLSQACGVDSGAPRRQDTGEASEALGGEDPSPAPGGLPPGGHEPGGPGDGWGSGFAGDSQYAPYVGPRDPDPYRAQREASQRESDRIREENHRHGDGGSSSTPAERFYNYGEPVFAPPAPRWLDGPLNKKAKCIEKCWNKHMDDDAYCRRLPTDQREECWRKSIHDYGECVRECSRKYPFDTET